MTAAKRRSFLETDTASMEALREIIRVQNSAQQVQQRLGLPDGFIDSLIRTGDDWSFVIKVSALVETAVSDFLNRTLNQPALVKDISKMPLSRKIQWTRKLGAIGGTRQEFVAQLSDLRNQLAHQIQKIPTFTLNGYLANLSDADHKQLTGLPKSTNTIQEALMLGNERYGIWFAVLHLILDLEDHHAKSEQQREAEFAARRQADIDALLDLLSKTDIAIEGPEEAK